MIEDYVKDKVIAITSFCDTDEKRQELINNIILLRQKFPNTKIALHANYPLSESIQKSVDYYLYQDLNFIGDDKWTYYWHQIINDKTGKPYFNKRFYYSILDTGFSVFQQIKSLTKFLIDYQWVLLINYDLSVEELNKNDYTTNYDLTVHLFPEGDAYSMIVMFYKPQVFYEKVVKYFTYENWMKPERVDQLNEQRFYDIIHESNISVFEHKHKITDKISGMPDYVYPDCSPGNKPNAPHNNFFKGYLLVQTDDFFEIYLWDLLSDISKIVFVMNDEIYIVKNQNREGGFEYYLPYVGQKIDDIKIKSINDVPVDIDLVVKKGYITRDV